MLSNIDSTLTDLISTKVYFLESNEPPKIRSRLASKGAYSKGNEGRYFRNFYGKLHVLWFFKTALSTIYLAPYAMMKTLELHYPLIQA